MREIVKARPLPILDGWLICEFDNGEKRLVDIKPSMKGVLEKLQNPEEFSKVYIDKEAGTVTWPGDIHIDPDTLYNRGIGIGEVENLTKAYNHLQKSGEWKDIV
jgi:Protein of unknown function (DUF2442)